VSDVGVRIDLKLHRDLASPRRRAITRIHLGEIDVELCHLRGEGVVRLLQRQELVRRRGHDRGRNLLKRRVWF
jgi:hypothetical protein